MRRAYCPPKSRTRFRRCSRGVSRSSPHSDALGRLFGLALGRERGREHDLGLLELFYVLVAGGRHAGPKGAHEVERPVVLARRSDEYLFEAPRGLGAYA